MANFEYKIHLSIDESGLRDNVKSELTKIAKEFKNNAFKIELTGDPKKLIQQLVELKKQVPDLDLTKGITFNLADAIKDDSEQSKKIINELTTYIINSVTDAVNSIDSISGSIQKTMNDLDSLKKRKKDLLTDDGAADAVTAFEKAEARLEKASNKFSDSKQNKGKLAAAEEMKQALRDILNYQTEAGKEMSEKTKQILGIFAQDVDKTFKDITGKEHTLKDFLSDVKVNSSYKKDLQAIESQIFETENKLTQLKKNLESAQNPELQVKGKLADNFLEDLQSQLDALQGLTVKVKPKVDKDVRLEVEVEAKPDNPILDGDGGEAPSTNLNGNPSPTNNANATISTYKEILNEIRTVKQEWENASWDNSIDEKAFNEKYNIIKSFVDRVKVLKSKLDKFNQDNGVSKKSTLLNDLERSVNTKFYNPSDKTNIPGFDISKDVGGHGNSFGQSLQELKTRQSNHIKVLNEYEEKYREVLSRIESDLEKYEDLRIAGQTDRSGKPILSKSDYNDKIKRYYESGEKELAAYYYYNRKELYPKAGEIKGLGKDFFDNYQENLEGANSFIEKFTTSKDFRWYEQLKSAIQTLKNVTNRYTDDIDKLQNKLKGLAEITKTLDLDFIDGNEETNIQKLDAEIEQLSKRESEILEKRDEILSGDSENKWQEEKAFLQENDLDGISERITLLKLLRDTLVEYKKENSDISKIQTRDKMFSINIEDLRNFVKGLYEAKEAVTKVSEATSTPPNTSAMDTVEEELHEEAQAHHENEEAAKADAKAQEEFNNSQHGNQNNLSSDTLAGKTFDELINVSNIKKGSNELNAALRESMEHLKAMYDAGDTESEEYVGTLYRIINLQKEMWKFNGGKGSSYDNLAKSTKDKGGKDVDVKMDLQDSIYKDFQDFSGTSKEVVDFVLEEFSRLKSDGSLIFDETGKLITASTRQRVQNVIDEVERETEVVRDNIEEQRNIVEQSQSSNKTTGLSSGTTTLSAIDEITQAEDRMGNEAQEATNQAKQGLAEMREEAEKTEETIVGFRKYFSGNGFINTRDAIAWLSSVEEIAKTYKGDTLAKAVLDSSKILTVDAKGADFGNITYNGQKMDTDQIAEYARQLGYLGVQIKNVKDAAKGGDVLSDTIAIFNKDLILGIENAVDDAPIIIEKKFKIKPLVDWITHREGGESPLTNDANNYTQEESEFANKYYAQYANRIGNLEETKSILNELETGIISVEEAWKKLDSLMPKFKMPSYTDSLDPESFALYSEEERKFFEDTSDVAGRKLKAVVEQLESGTMSLKEAYEVLGLLDKFSNETPVSTEGTSSTISQLEREAEIRQENVAATDAQIEAELKRQSVSSNVNPTDVNTEVDTLIQTQQVATSASEAVSHVKEEVAQTKQEMSDTSTPMLDSIESEASEATKSLDDVNKKIDTLANHPFPTNNPFENQKTSAMMSLRNLEDSLPNNYTGVVKQQITDLYTELSQLTEDDGLSKWASKFKIVADNVKDVNNETKALKDNLKNSKLDHSLSLDKSLKTKELDKYSAKLKELGLYSDETADKVAELYEKLGSVEDKNDLSIYNKELKLLQTELAEQVNIRQRNIDANKEVDPVKRKIDLLKQQYDYEIKLAGLNKDDEKYNIYKTGLDEAKKSINEIKLTQEQEAYVTEQTAQRRIAAEAAIADAKKKQSADIERENNKQIKSDEQAERKRTALLKRLSNLMLNGQIMKNSGSQIRNFFDIVQSEGGRSIDTLNKIEKEINEIEITAKSTGKTGQTMFQMLQQRWQSLGAYLGSFASFYQVVGYIRQMITSIKELDSALTEMRKVSDESISTLKAFQQESFGIADSVGSTAKVIQDSTADWMRLGESLDEAKESAKDASILLNVSEFGSIDEATTALVAMSQAYSDMDKIDIIDKLNNIGNNFSISTDQLATGLQNAAAVLKTQGNDIDKSIALLTVANSIVQDISKASTGMRTIALRIAGTETAKKELEELGESTEDYIVQTQSKTQETIKAYTAVASNAGKGVDVLDANGNLRDTYDILLDISKIYKEIQEEDKKAGTNRAKALVEYIAGKNRSNIAASVLENPELLEKVYEASQDSAGSAMEENEKYLDSIAGHITQLQNQLQKLYSDTISSDLIKGFVDFLKVIVELVDKVGLLQTALVGIGTVIGSKKLG